ncbi:MAG: hypothetical protein ACJ8F3_09170 [Xanthobacteraceae bacterium]
MGAPAYANMDPIRVTSKYPSLLRGLGFSDLRLDKPEYAVGESIGFSVVINFEAIKKGRILRGSMIAYIDSGDAIEAEREIKSLVFTAGANKTVPLHLIGPAATKPGEGKTFIVMGGDEAGDMVALNVV